MAIRAASMFDSSIDWSDEQAASKTNDSWENMPDPNDDSKVKEDAEADVTVGSWGYGYGGPHPVLGGADGKRVGGRVGDGVDGHGRDDGETTVEAQGAGEHADTFEDEQAAKRGGQ
jgi:hypothetical protein